jgi:MFS transporter, AAHS family, 4-hydroxybenzoate transporter
MALSDADVHFDRDQMPMSRSQWLVIFLCAMCMVTDGFGVQAMSYAAPALMKDWGISRPLLGPVFSASLFGMLVGSLLLAGIADSLGRRPTLTASLGWVAICMLLTPFARSIGQLEFARFATGIGVGIVIPNALALGGEYSPSRIRTMLVMAVSSGFIVGGVAGGATAALVIRPFGWVGVFYAGATLTGFLAMVMLFLLPESPQFALLRRPDDPRTLRLMRRFGLDKTIIQGKQVQRKRLLLSVLLGEGRACSTLSLWVAGFCNLLSAYFLAAWIPLLMSGKGYSSGSSALAGTAFWVGALIGNYLLGFLIDKRGYGPVLVANFVMGGLAIVGLSYSTQSSQISIACIALAGFSVIGGQSGLYAIAVMLYPTKGRATGIGFASGVGRIGAVLGPVVGGHLMALSWTMSEIIAASAMPIVVAALAVGILGFIQRRIRLDVQDLPPQERLSA